MSASPDRLQTAGSFRIRRCQSQSSPPVAFESDAERLPKTSPIGSSRSANRPSPVDSSYNGLDADPVSRSVANRNPRTIDRCLCVRSITANSAPTITVELYLDIEDPQLPNHLQSNRLHLLTPPTIALASRLSTNNAVGRHRQRTHRCSNVAPSLLTNHPKSLVVSSTGTYQNNVVSELKL